MKKEIGFVLAVFISAGILAGCTSVVNPKQAEHNMVNGSPLSDKLKGSNDFSLVERSPSLELYINGETTEIAVKEKSSGKMWFSNPVDRLNDKVATKEANDKLSSQIEIEYFDTADVSCGMNNYADSIMLDQYSIEKIDQGIRIIYTLGTVKKVYVAPKAISQKRFEELILNKLDEKDKKELVKRYKLVAVENIKSETQKKDLLAKYPTIENGPIYLLTENLAEFVMEDIEKIILKSGYTYENMVSDHVENKIQNEDLPVTFQIPVEYLLEKDSLVARVVSSNIKYPEGIKLTGLKFLKFFGAAGEKANGYLFVPDGSGAIIHFNNGKTNTPPYSEKLYGLDLTKNTEEEPAMTQKNLLNVYGIKTDSQSFISIIESGDAISSINADISGRLNSYNYVYPSFEMTQSMSMSVPYADAKEMNIYETSPFDKDLQLRFFFEGSKPVSYTQMANQYQQYLLDNNLLKKTEDIKPQFYIDLLGAVDYKDTFAGIPMKRIKTLTTYKQAAAIVKELYDGGISQINVRYKAFSNNGVNNTPMNKITFLTPLGSKKDFKDFVLDTEQRGGRMFADMELQYICQDKWFDGFRSTRDAAKNLLGKVASKPVYNVATGQKTDQKKMISPTLYCDYLKMASHDLEPYTRSVSFASLGQDLYSDYNKSDKIGRQDAIEKIKQVYKTADQENYCLLVDSGNEYALAYASHIINTPENSSGGYLFDEDIPFYQIVLHGVVPYSSEALNLSSDYVHSYLKMIETGENPYFSFMYASNDALKKVNLESYSLSYREWLADAAILYKNAKPVLDKTCSARITDHQRLSDAVSKTVYDNGVIVYVNYSDQKVSVDGIVVEGLSYITGQGGKS